MDYKHLSNLTNQTKQTKQSISKMNHVKETEQSLSKMERAILYCTETACYLGGTFHYQPMQTNTTRSLVVIVDDNSGSMQGPRQTHCIEKSKAIVENCALNHISYQYATFGSTHTLRGACSAADVQLFLRCNEGTKLMELANAAIEGAKSLLTSINPDEVFRIVFILNTDGEAPDGKNAGDFFNSSFGKLREMYPNMLEPRTFVLGIGKDHDQKVLGAMSVGESSYFNYPDAALRQMLTDTSNRILPELTSSTSLVDVIFSTGRTMTLRLDSATGKVSLDGIRVDADDVSLTLPNGEVIEFRIEVVEPSHPNYFEFKLNEIKDDAMLLVKNIQQATLAAGGGGKSSAVNSQMLDNLNGSCEDLRKKLAELSDSAVIESNGKDELMRIFESQAINPHWRQHMATCLRKVRQQVRKETVDRKAATRAVLELCEAGLRSAKIGSKLSTDLERDFMEVLGSGGYEHWTNKKKSKVVGRALDQVNTSAVTDIDAKAVALQNSMQSFSDVSSAAALSAQALSPCWLTLLTSSELTKDGDVMCLVGCIPARARNLAMCSVSSAKVLHQAVLSGSLSICPQPMSFLTIRGLLMQGQQITRGPNGMPINTVFCLLPSAQSELSIGLAKLYSPLSCSQLLTSRWIYTVGTTEYKNGMLVSFLSLSPSQFGCTNLADAMDGFYRQSFGMKYLKDALLRGMAVVERGVASSADVSTWTLAIADQMLLLAHNRCRDQMGAVMHRTNSTLTEDNNVLTVPLWQPQSAVGFWRILFLRVLRDKMDILFSAFCRPNDPEGDAKRRQKDIEAEEFLQLLVQGLNMPEVSVQGALRAELLGFQSNDTPTSAQNADQDDDDLSVVSIGNFKEEPELDKLDALADGSSGVTMLQPLSDQRMENTPLEDLSLVDLVSRIVSLKKRLPLREPVRSSSSEAAAAALGNTPPASCTGLTTDHLRCTVLEAVLSSMRPEINLMLSCRNHMHFQTTGEIATEPTNLLQLLDLTNDADGWEWLLGQLALAVKYRNNTAYRTEIASATSNLRKPVSEMLAKLAQDYNSKLILNWDKAQKEHHEILRARYARMLKTHPSYLARVPLRIRNAAHLTAINSWCVPHRGFAVTPATNPAAQQTWTGMARNTFMFPHSPHFMTSVNPFKILAEIYGQGSERVLSGYLEHLHTQSKLFFDATQSEESSQRYLAFLALFQAQYSADPTIALQLYTSMRIDEFITLRQTGVTVEGIMPELTLEFPAEIHAELLKFVSSELLWQLNPHQYLTQYFDNEPSRVKVTLEEFLIFAHANTADEKRLATEAYEHKQAAAVGGVAVAVSVATVEVDLGLSKKDRHALKIQRRLDRNNH